jgi:NitT/TauT family transport system substrate-binding protein
MRKAKLAPVLLTACLSVVISGCGAPAGDSKDSVSESREIDIGLIGLLSDAPIAIAMERGYFDSLDVELKVKKFKSGGDMVAPMASGDLDIGGGAFSAGMVNGVSSGNPMVIVADKGSFPTPELGSQQFVVRTDLANEIADFSDLANRKIGVGTAVGTASYSGIIQALQKAGIANPQAQIMSMASSDIVVALDQASVDAAWVSEPNAALAIQKGYAVPWKTANDVAPGEQDSTIFFHGDWAKANPELAQAFMDAYVCGVNDFLAGLENPDERKEILRILADYTATPVDVLSSSRMPGYFENGIPSVESIQHIVESFKDLGQIKTTVHVDQLVDLTYVKAAAGKKCK